MNQELQLGKYEFYRNEKSELPPKDRLDRIESLLEELIRELRYLRWERESTPEYTDEELENGYRALADEEAANPNYFDWVEGARG